MNSRIDKIAVRLNIIIDLCGFVDSMMVSRKNHDDIEPIKIYRIFSTKLNKLEGHKRAQKKKEHSIQTKVRENW